MIWCMIFVFDPESLRKHRVATETSEDPKVEISASTNTESAGGCLLQI